jgi:hypothetical protein
MGQKLLKSWDILVELISNIFYLRCVGKNQNGGNIADGAAVDFLIFRLYIQLHLTNFQVQHSFGKMLLNDTAWI